MYFYRVGNPLDGFSPVYNFRATRTTAELSEEEPLSLLWLGDLGYENAQSWGSITTGVAEGLYDSAVLVGDWVRSFVLLLTLLCLAHVRRRMRPP